MSLVKYKQKRNFKKTPEPKGKAEKSHGRLAFVVQRHKATRLHYDFRLEMDGVLKSWAVPKGPSLNPDDKRLAMMVEDHPYDYKDFAGIIPEGNYGAGIVEIWDSGYFTDIDNSDSKTAEKKLLAALEAGSVKVVLHGKKLKGEFALVKMKNTEDNAWLLLKHNDEYAVHEPYDSEENTPANSPINKWLTEKNKPVKKKVVKRRTLPGKSRKLSSFIAPMLAMQTDKPFDDPNWVFELKWDGYRAIAEVDGSNVLMYSRNGNTFNNSYPTVVDELAKQNINAVIDGEIVVLDENGRPSFQMLQDYDSNRDKPICYYVFDVLEIDGKNVCHLPLVQRKELLKELITPTDVIRYSDHIAEEGKAFFELAGKKELEGIIAKKADSEYFKGIRTGNWLKIKHHKTQEAIIAGFTAPGGSRKYFGALVLGIYDDGKLKYVGHTGSGFNDKGLKEMDATLQSMITDESPFNEPVKTNQPVTWVRPELVCEIKYSEWTRDGSMRHPIFLHLRPDKKPQEVTMKAAETVSKKEIKEITKHAKTPDMEKKTEKLKEADKIISYGKIKLKVTNLNKVFWPDDGITKGDVIEYYQKISKYILPYIEGRPQSLYRTPNGIKGEGFFQKDAGGDAPEWVKTHVVHSESNDKDINYIICDDEPTLVYLANLGCIEINPWHSQVGHLDMPDYLMIDLDPSDGNTFEQVIETANIVHEVLERAGATNFCKTSGATGLHVYVPTSKKYSYEEIKDFAEVVCALTHEQLPDFTSMERNLKERGKKLYLDHLQNRRGQTISCAYSLRPKPGAPVSTPLEWSEVKSGLTPQQFNINNTLKRIEKKGDLFSGVLGKGIDMMKCLKKLGG